MTKPRLALLTALSVVAYLGLAIVGAGGAADSFPFRRCRGDPLTVALGIAGLFTEGHIGSGVREDRSIAG